MAAVAQVTTYSELQSHVADTLNRTDLTTPITTFIQMAEATFKRDRRFRKIADRGTFTISADGATLPTDFQSLESWYHDGPTFRGPITIVNSDMIGELKVRYGATGTPGFAAIVDGLARFAPEPNGTFNTQMIYWRRISPLSASNTTNWLLDDHPDLYIYGALLHTAPYLKDDARIAVWQALYNAAAEELHQFTEWNQFSGSLRRQVKPIG